MNKFDESLEDVLSSEEEEYVPIPTHKLMSMDSRELEARKAKLEELLELRRQIDLPQDKQAIWKEWLFIQSSLSPDRHRFSG
jgi:hypothetical protein